MLSTLHTADGDEHRATSRESVSEAIESGGLERTRVAGLTPTIFESGGLRRFDRAL